MELLHLSELLKYFTPSPSILFPTNVSYFVDINSQYAYERDLMHERCYYSREIFRGILILQLQIDCLLK